MNDGIAFFLSFLVLLLALMLGAVLRLPPAVRSLPVEDDQFGSSVPARPEAVRLNPARPAPVPAPPQVPAPARMRQPAGAVGGTSALAFLGGAAGQPGRTKYAPRHVSGPEPARATIRAPKVAGRPPWGPAPRPPGPRS
jgi:hypothetical protein